MLLALANAPSPVPTVFMDACTMECCTYREWTATSSTQARVRFDLSAPPSFPIKKGERVHALRGVVVVSHPGITVVLKAVKLGYQKDGDAPLLSLKPGDELVTLYPMGEGYIRFSYNGKTYADQIAMTPGFGDTPFTGVLEVKSQPAATWWVEVRNESGAVGWIDKAQDFSGADACE
jgi:hypothetical protein